REGVLWDWKVAAYIWTKAIAAGIFLVLFLASVLNVGPLTNSTIWLGLVTSLVLLAVTGFLLVKDLDQPRRFLYVLLRPQWRSWLVRGAFVIGAYALGLTAHLLWGWRYLVVGAGGAHAPPGWLVVATGALALATAVYTAYLFAQAKARDLWQSPLLPAHLAVQSLLAGAALLYPLLAARPEIARPTGWLLVGCAALHLLLVAGELTLTHGTAHARRAVAEMTRGRYRGFFWTSVAAIAFSLTLPITGLFAAAAALVGLAAYEHAYVQAAQAVPLA
ncbi:MAG: NrfD/PsrC family molybdoenzyme membrane anchor subunit, partial [Thermoanaerobaculia bacterium]|nr:NrfD/PsrC family molybdoenzyme membrane anchor subunit [Thermoanaerobaculia bacterium]